MTEALQRHGSPFSPVRQTRRRLPQLAIRRRARLGSERAFGKCDRVLGLPVAKVGADQPRPKVRVRCRRKRAKPAFKPDERFALVAGLLELVGDLAESNRRS